MLEDIVLYRNGVEETRAYWTQVSSDGGNNYYSANCNGLQTNSEYEIRLYSPFYWCYMSANGYKTTADGFTEFNSPTNSVVKFNITGYNLTGNIAGNNGYGFIRLTSFTGGLSDFTAKGYERYEWIFGREDPSTISYGYNCSAEFTNGGSTPTYDYTDDDLVSAIDTSGLYAIRAGTSNKAYTSNSLINHGTMGGDITQSSGGNYFIYMPDLSPWTTAGVATGIFSPLQYATGACLAMDAGYFKGFYKGNEWFVGDTGLPQMLRGEVHQARGVHVSGCYGDGKYFNLSVTSVRGVSNTANNYGWLLNANNVTGSGVSGSWKYGPEEDTLLRSLSSQIAYLSGVINQNHS